MPAPAAMRFLNKLATVFLAVAVYVVAILLLPLAAVVVLVSIILRKFDSSDDSGDDENPSMVWAFAVMAAAMVINIAVLPIGLFWDWLLGKPSPSSPEIGSHR